MTRKLPTGLRAALFPLSIALLLTACGGGGGGGGSSTGTLNLSVTDAPVDNADAVWVEFTGIEIKPANGSSFDINFASPKRINLLALNGGTAEVLLDGEILDAGTYNWMRLKVNATQGGDPADDSYIVIGGTPHELRIHSGDQSGLKLNRPITIPEGNTTSFTIDFDLRKSVHERSGGIYHLRPTLRLVDNSMDGSLAGSVDPSTISAECISGDKAAVYVFEGAGTTPDDVNIDGNDIEPVATTPVDWANSNNSYRVAFLEAGTYTAAFTCDAGMDDPAAEDTLTFVGTMTVTINAGQTTTLNF